MSTASRGRSMSRVVRSVAHTTQPPLKRAVPFMPGSHAALPAWPLSAAQYHDLIENGVLMPHDRVELIHGWMVEKMPNNPPHRFSVKRVYDRLLPLLGPEYYVTSQLPITLPE